MKQIQIIQEPIDLNKLMKFESLVSSGGEANSAIVSGIVKVNGELETRKRRKLMAGDVVEFMQESYEIILVQPTTQ
ncbi:RNA-binding S4 domain-containing protein [Paraglaciecola sp.]|uniref:RNA-binding S4 domain-containing protein n=1 Tax=Paraglaciecola sp. TaxID=1920173 RepID=UPI0030F3BCCD